LVPENEIQGFVHPHPGQDPADVRSELGSQCRRQCPFTPLGGVLEFGQTGIQNLQPPAYAQRLGYGSQSQTAISRCMNTLRLG
jgi:hypothetical protein